MWSRCARPSGPRPREACDARPRARGHAASCWRSAPLVRAGAGHGATPDVPPSGGRGSAHGRGSRAGEGGVALSRRLDRRRRAPGAPGPISARRERPTAPRTSRPTLARPISTTPTGRRSAPRRSSSAGHTAGWRSTGIGPESPSRERVGDFDVHGATVVLELVLDDYAEIWVDGRLPIVLGQSGGQLIDGFNAPNRVVLTSDARPGQQIQLAIFGANGPISNPPANYIWVRSATLDFYASVGRRRAIPSRRRLCGWIRRWTRSWRPDAVEKLAGGFQFTEGPVWHPDGYLLFSDPNANTIYRWTPDGAVSVFRTKSGYTGFDIGEYHQPGSNGLTLDPDGPGHHQRAWQPPRYPAGEVRQDHRPRRPLRGQAAQQPERSRLPLRRHALLHRSALRPAEVLRRPARRNSPSAASTW